MGITALREGAPWRARPSVAALLAGLGLLAALAHGACAPRRPPAGPSPRAASHVRAGVEALERGEVDRAEAELTLALEFSPDMPEAHNGLGLVALARGDDARARACFAQAVRANADFVEGHANLGAVEMRRLAWEAALPHLERALGIDPGYAPARLNLGRALFALGRLQEARAAYLAATSVARGDGEAWGELAVVELATGHREAAGQAARTALELVPGHRGARRVLANLRRDAGDLESARREYDALVAEDGADPRALVDRATLHLLAGRPAEARDDAWRAAELGGASVPEALFALGAAEAALGDDAAAETALFGAELRAEERGRAFPEATLLRARAIDRLGRAADAAAAYELFVATARGIPALAGAVEEARARAAALRAASPR